MKIKLSYYEWNDILKKLDDKFDFDILEDIKLCELDDSPAVVKLFYNRIFEIIKRKLKIIENEFSNLRANDEKTLFYFIESTRKKYSLLYKLINIKCVKRYNTELEDMVVSKFNEIQNSLEESAKNDRTGRMLIFIKNNPVTKI